MKEAELELFGQRYNNLETNRGLKWWYGDTFIYIINIKNKPFKIKYVNLKLHASDLLVKLNKRFMKRYKPINCYQDIPVIANNYEFSDKNNFFIFDDGTVTEFIYHKYYRAYDKFCLKSLPKINWEGQAFGMRCKKISKKLVLRLNPDTSIFEKE